jgi:choline-sulfatase
MATAQDQSLNFLLLLVDQFRFDALGCAGNPVVQTPNLDRLATEGVRFTQAYTEVPVCVAARAGLITGQYPHRLGTIDNNGVCLDDQPTLPRLLRDQGRATMAIGKMHFFPRRNHLGFDRMLLSEGLVGHPWDDDYARFMGSKGYPILREMHGPGHPHVDGSSIYSTYYKPGTLPYPEEVSATAWVADRTGEFIEANRDRPFFCFSSFIKPHPPLLPPKPYDELYDPDAVDLPSGWDEVDSFDPLLAAQSRFKGVINPTEFDVRRMRSHYYGLVSHVDHHVGRILDMLDQAGLRERTVVVFSADHGELLGDHGHWGKRSFHEGAAKIPLVISCPARFVAGRSCDKLVGLTDILPTFVELAGGTTPPAVSGRSLVPLLKDTGAPWDRTLFGAYGGFRGIVQMADRRISTSFMVRWEQWKYVYYVNGGREQLFDLQEDPQELHNVAQHHPHLCAAAKQELMRHLIFESFEAYVDNNALLELPFQAEFNEVVVQPNRTTEHTVEAGRS